MITWFLNLRNFIWYAFPHLGPKDISFSSYYLKHKYVELKQRKRMQLKSSILPS
jgi:hypothetical protein